MSVTTQWRSLMDVLTAFAPGTAASFQPGASASDIDAVEAALGVTFPADLREWFSVQNGQIDPAGGFGGELLAQQEFFSLDRVVAEHATLLRLGTEMVQDNPDTYPTMDDMVASAPEAGTVTDVFIPAYVPISGFQNIDNLVDTRRGKLHGCVSSWAYDAGEAGAPLWPSIEAMLAEIERHIVEGPPAGWLIQVEDGQMYWEVDRSGMPGPVKQQFYDPGFADDPNFVVKPKWPDYYDFGGATEDMVDRLRVHHVPRDESVDLIAAQQAAMDAAVRTYRGRVTMVAPHGMYGGFSLARTPGAQLTILVGIDGELKVYSAIATDSVGGFRIEEHPQNPT